MCIPWYTFAFLESSICAPRRRKKHSLFSDHRHQAHRPVHHGMVLKPATRSPPRRQPRDSLLEGERWYKASVDGNSMSLMSRIQDRMQELRDARISEAAASTAEAMASSDVKIMPSENAPAPSDLVPTIALSETIASTSDAIQPRCRHTCESGPTANGQDVSCSSEETTAAAAPSEATPSTPTSNPKRRDGVPGLRVSFDTDSEPVVDDPQPSSIKQSPEAVVESARQLSSATIVVPKPAKVHVPSPASHMINPLEQPPDVPCSWLCCWTHTPSGGWRSAWLFWESPLFLVFLPKCCTEGCEK